MIKLSQLAEVADQTLGGLNAGPALFNRAKIQADQTVQVSQRPKMSRVLAFALSLALVIGIGGSALSLFRKPTIPTMDSMPAGVSLNTALSSAALNLPRGSLILSKDRAPEKDGVWAQGSSGNFPLLRVNDRFYRLLTRPEDVSALAGQSVGLVEITTDEPALDSGKGILSNIVALNEAVYSLPGMEGAVVAAKVGNDLRAFQRVAFSGIALIGNEKLRDTLPQGVTALQLTGIGTVSEPDAVARLMGILFDQASYQGSQLMSSKQTLLLQYTNGVVLQMSVSGENFSAAGTWACPAFFDEFAKAVK